MDRKSHPSAPSRSRPLPNHAEGDASAFRAFVSKHPERHLTQLLTGLNVASPNILGGSHDRSSGGPSSSSSSNVTPSLSARTSLTGVPPLSQPKKKSLLGPSSVILKKISVDLALVYRQCNPSGFKYVTSQNPKRVLTKPSEGVYNGGFDNVNSDFILYVNEILTDTRGIGAKYQIIDLLGQGTFGQVVKCKNLETEQLVAVKVVKNKPAYLTQGLVEVRILELLNQQYDADDSSHIVRLQEYFMCHKHLCLVFELLSLNLYELIKQTNFKGVTTNLVRIFITQILKSLAVLAKASVIHCDLKPENILLLNPKYPQLKLIDFGSACFENQTVYSYIQSRFYRSPEVLLGCSYRTSIDMWSLGCIAAELLLGLPLFPGSSEFNQMYRIVDMIGMPPEHMLERGKSTHKFFNKRRVSQHSPPSSADSLHRQQYIYTLKTEEEYAKETGTQPHPSKKYFNYRTLEDIIAHFPFKSSSQQAIEQEKQNRRALTDFIRGLLVIDPELRWTPEQAIKHPFITGQPWTGPWQPEPPRKSSSAVGGVLLGSPYNAPPIKIQANSPPTTTATLHSRGSALGAIGSGIPVAASGSGGGGGGGGSAAAGSHSVIPASTSGGSGGATAEKSSSSANVAAQQQAAQTAKAQQAAQLYYASSGAMGRASDRGVKGSWIGQTAAAAAAPDDHHGGGGHHAGGGGGGDRGGRRNRGGGQGRHRSLSFNEGQSSQQYAHYQSSGALYPFQTHQQQQGGGGGGGGKGGNNKQQQQPQQQQQQQQKQRSSERSGLSDALRQQTSPRQQAPQESSSSGGKTEKSGPLSPTSSSSGIPSQQTGGSGQHHQHHHHHSGQHHQHHHHHHHGGGGAGEAKATSNASATTPQQQDSPPHSKRSGGGRRQNNQRRSANLGSSPSQPSKMEDHNTSDSDALSPRSPPGADLSGKKSASPLNSRTSSSSKLNPKGLTSPRSRTTSHEQTPPVPPVSVYAPTVPRGASPSPTAAQAASTSASSSSSGSGVVQGTTTGGGGDPPLLTSSSSASRITQHGVSPTASTEESILKEKSAEKPTPNASAGYTPPLPRKNSNTSIPRKPE